MRFLLILLTGLCLAPLGGAQAWDARATMVSAPSAGHASIPGSGFGLSPDCTKNPLGDCLWQVSFAIDGVPGQALGGPSLGSGYRSTLARGGFSTDGKHGGTENRAVVFLFQYANGKTRTVGLHVDSLVGTPKLTGAIKHITIRGRIQYTDLPGCTPGIDGVPGTLALFDLGNGGNDYVILTACGRTRSYKLGQPGQARVASIAVSIKPL